MMKNRNSAGVYVHIPFCIKKCSYCNFYSKPINDEVAQRLVEALLIEIDGRARLHNVAGSTLYVGGGTPTALSPSALCSIIGAARKAFSVAKEAEITVEANPGTLHARMVDALVTSGVNRVSVGVQAKQENVLKSLSRVHDANDVERSIARLRKAGITNINADLMCGLPGLQLNEFRDSLYWVLDQGITHLSLYPLQLEEGTPLAQAVSEGRAPMTDEDATLEQMYLAEKVLKEYGFIHYEIANYALPGFESKHNLIYWRNSEYVGCGPSAASYLNGTRFSNVSSIAEYLSQIDYRGCPTPIIDEDSRNPDVAMAETVFLGLRLLREGVSVLRFEQRFGLPLVRKYGSVITELVAQGLVEHLHDRVLLTPKAIPIANQVFSCFLP